MIRNPKLAALATSAYLVAYCILLSFEQCRAIAVDMFALSPFVMVWLAFTVLMDKKYTGKELPEGAEYGYGHP